MTKGYSAVQVKVRNGTYISQPLYPLKGIADDVIATSNDPWGPTGTDMSEIAALTFNK